MRICSAFDEGFRLDEASVRSAVLVSNSRHAKVYRCCFNLPEFASEQFYCVKILKADGSFLEHQLSLFTRISQVICDGEVLCDCEMAYKIADCGTLPLLHFGVIPANAYKKNNETLYVITPWFEGHTLHYLITKAIQSKRTVTIFEALVLLRAVVTSMYNFSRCDDKAYLVHQDIKPSNIFISPNSQPRAVIIDLDTAFFLDEVPQSVPCGSFGYTAPESISHNNRWPNETIDIFSFGVVAHEIFTGHWPYPFPPRLGDDLLFWTSYFRQKDALYISQNLPSDIRSLIESCVSLSPYNRPSHECLVKHLDILLDRYAQNQEAFCPLQSGATSSWMLANEAIADTF